MAVNKDTLTKIANSAYEAGARRAILDLTKHAEEPSNAVTALREALAGTPFDPTVAPGWDSMYDEYNIGSNSPDMKALEDSRNNSNFLGAIPPSGAGRRLDWTSDQLMRRAEPSIEGLYDSLRHSAKQTLRNR